MEVRIGIKYYLKVDVDGIEYKIIEESDLLLKNKNLKSILIEINSNRKEDLNQKSKGYIMGR